MTKLIAVLCANQVDLERQRRAARDSPTEGVEYLWIHPTSMDRHLRGVSIHGYSYTDMVAQGLTDYAGSISKFRFMAESAMLKAPVA